VPRAFWRHHAPGREQLDRSRALRRGQDIHWQVAGGNLRHNRTERSGRGINEGAPWSGVCVAAGTSKVGISGPQRGPTAFASLLPGPRALSPRRTTKAQRSSSAKTSVRECEQYTGGLDVPTGVDRALEVEVRGVAAGEDRFASDDRVQAARSATRRGGCQDTQFEAMGILPVRSWAVRARLDQRGYCRAPASSCRSASLSVKHRPRARLLQPPRSPWA